jgi:hypothetical protein
MSIIKTALILILFLAFSPILAKSGKQEFFEIRIYHLKSDAGVATVEKYLEKALLPALHRAGIQNIGVFKPIEPDTTDRRIYVLIPYQKLSQIDEVAGKLLKDDEYQRSGSDYINASYDNPPYSRIESIILKAFSHQPGLLTPALTGNRSERVYELRSYEGHTEKIFRNKVHMFNEGGEIALFKRLGFNAVFYGEVVSGSRMPNLMYMTTFDNKQSRDEHWKNFGQDAEWKKLSSMKEYQNNVSKMDIWFLRPTTYSDY